MNYDLTTLIISSLCNVATLISNVATLVSNTLWNVVTFPRTSRRWHNPSLSRHDVVPNVATLPCFKAKNSPFCSSHPVSSLRINPSTIAHPSSPSLLELPITPVGGSYIALRPSLCTSPSPSHTGSLSP